MSQKEICIKQILTRINNGHYLFLSRLRREESPIKEKDNKITIRKMQTVKKTLLRWNLIKINEQKYVLTEKGQTLTKKIR